MAGFRVNRIVKQKNIRALKASCIIVIEKCPGVHPIGLGEALWQILCKVIALATYTDLEEVFDVAQLFSGLCPGMEEIFMLFVSCLIFILTMIGEYCLLMLKMCLILSIVRLH